MKRKRNSPNKLKPGKIASHLEALIEGRPPGMVRKTLYLSESEFLEFQEVAERLEKSCSELVDAMIKDFLTQYRSE